MRNKIGIIGYGEIGSGLYSLYNKFNYPIAVLDPKLEYKDEMSGCYILNICIPFSDNFVDIVNDYINKYKPFMTIIHSTIAPGTTKKIIGAVCHSPVRGTHPNIYEGLKTFLKYIGSEDSKIALKYQEHLTELGIKSYICKDSKTTEYSKLLDTTYYGLCIAFHSDVLAMCEKENLDFYEVMTLFNTTYNEGYGILNKHNYIRPVLYGDKKIGGHCVVPNAKILKNYFDSNIIDNILKYDV
jgi:3-hydroxyisobutyrate dehydrogenase-like beta-hydroxyacid dehydrogenase